MAGKTLKGIIKDITKAAEGGKFDRFVKLVGELIAAVTEAKPAPKGAASAAATKGLPTDDDAAGCRSALDLLGEYTADVPESGVKPAAMGLFGGSVRWQVLIPVLADVVRKILDGLVPESDEGDDSAE